MTRRLLLAAAAVAGLVVLAAAGLWLFFDANAFRPNLEAAMGGAVGRTVTLGTIRLAVFSGSLSIDEVAIGDDPAFSTSPFVTAKRVSVGVRLMPLVFSRSLHVESFTLEQPRVSLLRSKTGRWNFSSLGAAASSSPPGPKGAGVPASSTGGAASVLVAKIAITGGQVSIADVPATGKARVYEDVNIDVTNVSPVSSFPFRLTAKTPGGGSLDLTGEAGPIDARDAAATPIKAAIAVKHLDVAATGFVDPSSGVAGLVDFGGSLTSDGTTVRSKGNVTATRARLVPNGAPAAVPLQVDYETEYAPKTRHGVVKRGDVRVGQATARLTGDYDLGAAAPAVRLKLAGSRMAATELQAALPALGITLPTGASLSQGTLDADLAIAGPIDHLAITGPVALSNATIKGFDLAAKLSAIAALAGLPHMGDTTIQTLGAAVHLGPQGTQIDAMNIVAPIIGTLTGSGRIDPKGAIEFPMLALLSATRGTVAGVMRAASLGQPGNGVPFRIQGTMSNPTFVPDVSRAVRNLVTSEETKKKAGSLLGGLFRKKKP